MAALIRCISPVDGSVYVERPLADGPRIAQALTRAREAQRAWRALPIADRQVVLGRAVDAFVQLSAPISEEITWQMGRPITQSPGEVRGFEERARYMIEIAPQALADIKIAPKEGFTRFIRREPLGVVLVLAPWNYPYLTAVNAVFPALLAGNAVLLKHSAQTPLCAERFAEALRAGGLPEGLFAALHLGHEAALELARAVDFVAFTGSVPGGHALRRALAEGFVGAGLELGGKDPAYVRPDADLAHAIANLADGAFFNAGQSCCGIERIYVHADVYEPFVAGLAEAAAGLKLGNPLEPETTLGPMVRTSAAEFVRRQVSDALAAGARALVDPAAFPAAREGTPYLAPQVLVDVDHSMEIMTEETFGPVVGVMRVHDDDEAVRLMNDSRYGLTAAVWTADPSAAVAIGDRVETGTWFMNRCDYLDPALAWVGVKDSGRGCTLSRLGYEQLTRPKSFHLRTRTR